MDRLLRLLLIVAGTLGLVAPSALAQSGPEPGVTIDPNSPAAKEYALPVDKARSNAQGKKKSSKDAPLFGEGVTKSSGGSTEPSTARSVTPSPGSAATPQASSTARSGSATSTGGKRKRAAARKRKVAKRRAGEKRRAQRARESAGAGTSEQAASVPAAKDVAQVAAGSANPGGGGLGTTLIIAGIGLGVLLVGGIAGLLLRRTHADS
jgi:hypothetical protein